MPERKFVIDTSLFVNPAARQKFGKNPAAAVRSFVRAVEKMDIDFYMPPLIFKELCNFIDAKTARELEIRIKKKSANMHAIYLPAAIFDDFIEDIRNRINRGLRLAEEFAIDNTPDNQVKLKKLRDKYRALLRAGILDSKEDFELLLLAKELDATLVTSDEGVIKFADKIGCEWINAERFYDLLSKFRKK
ncbi:RNA ligase partner protein [Candidatus Micrarchaeota archaeon]|nr:RNA ligase partner protein [Candidatus Micrarchaeota archaeon]